ncbi:MAG: hypothetical protein O3C27_12555 [Actinomycetota bacterium]|nr:hypothetical protein [Actinomycetota bacterium]
MGLPEELINRLAPLTLATDRVLPVPDVLSPLFPWGGIQRGWSVGVGGAGAWSLAFAIWAEALGAEGWVAVIGVPDLGLAAAAEFGVRLDRVVLVQTPPAGQWSTVVSSALDAFDVVAVAPTAQVSPRDARRLSARAREREAVLFHLDGGRTWPSALDLTLHTRVEETLGWAGLGRGHGHLQRRGVSIDAVGRRTGHPRSLGVLLPDVRGCLAAVPVQGSFRESPVLVASAASP